MNRSQRIMKQLVELPRGGHNFTCIIKVLPVMWILAVDKVMGRVHVIDTGHIRLEYKP